MATHFEHYIFSQADAAQDPPEELGSVIQASLSYCKTLCRSSWSGGHSSLLQETWQVLHLPHICAF